MILNVVPEHALTKGSEKRKGMSPSACPGDERSGYTHRSINCSFTSFQGRGFIILRDGGKYWQFVCLLTQLNWYLAYSFTEFIKLFL